MSHDNSNCSKGAIVLEGHVQGLSNVRSLGELGIPVYVIDKMHCLAMHSKYCKKFFRVDDFVSDSFIEFLIDLAKSEGLSGWMLVPSNDHIVENLSRHKDCVKKYYRVLVPSEKDLYRIINKLNLLKIAYDSGVHIPDTCSADNPSVASRLRYPVLVRGALGLTFYKTFHKKAIPASTYEELQEIIGAFSGNMSLSDIMVQELIPYGDGSEVVSFTCFAVNGDIKSFWMGRKLREHPAKYGTGTLAVSVMIPEIIDDARALVAALGYTGVCEIEFMFDNRDGQYKLIEVNPRTWLWVGLAKACGVDYAKIMYRYLDGQQQEFPLAYETDVKWVNSLTDSIFAMKRMLISGDLPILEFFDSLKGKKVHAVWSWDDFKPGILFPFLSFYIAKKRA